MRDGSTTIPHSKIEKWLHDRAGKELRKRWLTSSEQSRTIWLEANPDPYPDLIIFSLGMMDGRQDRTRYPAMIPVNATIPTTARGSNLNGYRKQANRDVVRGTHFNADEIVNRAAALVETFGASINAHDEVPKILKSTNDIGMGIRAATTQMKLHDGENPGAEFDEISMRAKVSARAL
ncbi:unnamed protein product [Phytophthora lilii]|uniref:Unnamed protein product n=1 Tax=Phytophthora lilii TaxID=2077276 RepID=A0A9W6TZZ0_9STRA|nr:unnamed protein product [Phytophthora lilii]